MFFEQTDDGAVVRLRVIRDVGRAAATHLVTNCITVEDHSAHIVASDLLQEGRVVLLFDLGRTGTKAVEYRQQNDRDHDPEKNVFCQIIQRITPAGSDSRHAWSQRVYTPGQSASK